MVCQNAKNGVSGVAVWTSAMPEMTAPTESPSASSPNSSPPLQKSRHLPSSEGKSSENGGASAVRPAIAAVSFANETYLSTIPTSDPDPTLAQSALSQSNE